ncbi:GntR family transcriptional regulator [Aurantivibrio plasticivorans]
MTQLDDWDDSKPIYRQLRDKVISLIIDGSFAEGEAIPSVRQVSSDYRINHLTVSKAYQELVEDGLLEARRGLGMFVKLGAKRQLLESQRMQFIEKEIPELLARLAQLGISKAELVSLLKDEESNK